MKWTISRQLADSPTPQQDASDTIGGLIYLYSPHIFLSQINIISPKILTRPRLKYTDEWRKKWLSFNTFYVAFLIGLEQKGKESEII